jgi:uncharacterized membrane protein
MIKGKRIPARGILVVLIFVAFCCIFFSINLVNHYLFRTYAHDLGMQTKAIYDFAHLRMNLFTLAWVPEEVPYFGDHFALLVPLVSPLYYVFGSYTLLVVQVLFVLFAGYGIFRYASFHTANRTIPVLAVLHFFGIWGIYSALSFDYHNNLLAAMLVPWFVLYYEQRKIKPMLLFFVLIVISQENMALWMAFILLGLYIKDKFSYVRQKPILSIGLPVITLVYFVVIVFIVMPAINKGMGTLQMGRYGLLGGSPAGILNNLINNPRYFFSLLFESPLQGEMFYGIKSEFWFMLLVCGGFAMIWRPWYLVMILPLLAQKMFTDQYGRWGINDHYSIEFAPILTLAVIDFLGSFKTSRSKVWMMVLVVFLTHYFNLASMDNRRSIWYDSQRTRFYQKKHYQGDLNVRSVREGLKIIPPDARISVHSRLAPHLAFREKIYLFPNVKDAEYIVLLREGHGTYPLTEEEYPVKIRHYEASGEFKIIYDKDDLLILKRVADSPGKRK